jgi:formamidopyrimidine-DNA glycosylase
VYQGDDYLKATQIKKLGLDPLDEHFNWQYLKKQINKCHKAIKTTLLDQTKLSGLGNIYVDEVLFLSRIHPLTKPSKLRDQDFKNIAKFSKQTLLKAIKYGGTTVSSYRSDPNHAGRFQNMLLVHTRVGLPCYVCKTIIKKIKVNGRGTYFCPKCQKEIR